MSALWDKAPTTYTSFGLLQSDAQSSGNIISRFLRRGKDDSSAESSRASSRDVSVDRSTSGSREASVSRDLPLDKEDSKSRTPEKTSNKVSRNSSSNELSKSQQWSNDKEGKLEDTSSQDDQATKRTLSSVITRLSAILDRRTATPQVYRDSDFKQFWMPDSSCKECYECGDKFTTFRRRHHCRICGQIFCNACCSQELPGKTIGYKGSIRVCIYCHRVVNQYAQQAGPSADPKVTKEVLHKCLTGDGPMSPEQGGLRRSTLDPQYNLSLRSPSDPDSNQDSTAPFDLTPQAEFISSENWYSERRLLTQDSSQLRSLWTLMMDPDRGLLFQSYRIRLRTYQKCIAGNKLVDWLLKQDKAANRVQAVAIGQALIDADYLDPTHNITTPFRDDFTLYRPNEMILSEQSDLDLDRGQESAIDDGAPLWFQEIQSNASQDGTLGDGSSNTPDIDISDHCSTLSNLSHDSQGQIRVAERHFDDPLPQQNMIGSVDVPEPIFENVMVETEKASKDETTSWRTLDISSEDSVEKEAFDKLQLEHHEHLTTLTNQLLYEEGLPSSWADIIISTVDRVSLFVKPDVRNNSDDMDIRKYVHIKKIPGGKREQTALVHGVIFKKNIAHKKMAHNINSPSILLLAGSIEYQRVEHKMSSLQPQILQEEEFLHKVIGKIVALKTKPDVLVVEKSVSRLAQNYLLKKGITLIYNVKQSVMERLSRFLDTDIARSVDSLMGGVKLGFCHTFFVKNFLLPTGENKTMLYFDGCATHLGCAVTLRGATGSELKKVKKIMKFMIYASYHSRLEISFCMDEFLMPPSKYEIDFGLEEQSLFDHTRAKTKERQSSKGAEKSNEGTPTHIGKITFELPDEKSGKGKPELAHAGIKKDMDSIDGVGKNKNVTKPSEKEGKITNDLEESGSFVPSDLQDDDDTDKDDMLDETGDSDITIGDSSVDSTRFESQNEAVSRVECKKVLNAYKHLEPSYTQSSSVCKSSQENTNEDQQYVEGDTDKDNDKDRISSFIRIQVSEEDTNDTQLDNNQAAKTACDSNQKSATTAQKREATDVSGGDGVDLKMEATDVSGGSGADMKREVTESTLSTCTFTLGSEVVAENDEVEKGQTDTLTVEPSAMKTNNLDGVSCDKNNKSGDQSISKKSGEQSPSKKFGNQSPSKTLASNTSDVVKVPQAGNQTAIKDSNLQENNKTTQDGNQSSMNLMRRNRNQSGQRSDKSPSIQRKSATVQLTDNSDPLHNYQISQDDSIFQSNLSMEEQLMSHRFKFKKSLDSVILSVGPYIRFDLPYLETETGSKCELRKYFPEEIYWSSHFCTKPGQGRPKSKHLEGAPVRKQEPPSNIQITAAHEFVRCQLENDAHHMSTKHMLAKFRAYGGRINVLENGFHQPKPAKSKFDPPKSSKEKPPGETTVPAEPVREAMTFWERRNDCLDPFRHQRIAVLFSSYSYESENHPYPCVSPWVVHMEFYGKNDITLGGFLERFCFRPSYVCPSDSCNTSMLKHIRRFVHGLGSISIVLKKLEHPIQNGQQNILIWSWCHKCKQVTPVIPMSSDTWHMSFAKYLELRFHGKQFQRRASFEPCLHSLHHEHFQYFGFRDTVASFKYSTIKLKEIKLSPLVIAYKPVLEVIQLYRHRDEVKRLTNKVTDLCSQSLDCLTKMKAEGASDSNLVKAVNDCIAAQQVEKTAMREIAHGVREKINAMLKPDEDKKLLMLNKEQRELYADIEDGMVQLKRVMAESVLIWNAKFQDLYVQQKKSRQASGQKKDKDTVSVAGTIPSDAEDTKPKPPDVDTPTISPSNVSEDVFSMSGSEFSGADRRRSDFAQISFSPPQIRQVSSALSLDTCMYGVTPGISAIGLDSPISSVRSDSYVVYNVDEVPAVEDLPSLGDSLEYTSVPASLTTISSEKSLKTFAENRGEKEDWLESEKITPPEALVPKVEPTEDQTDSGDKIGAIRKTIMNTIWQGSGAYQLQMPFELYEHYLLPQCDRLPVVVYDHEPSSIIAYSLSCHDYEVKLQEIQAALSMGHRSSSSSFDATAENESASLSKKPSSSKLSFFKGNGKESTDVGDTVRYVPRSDNGLLESPEADAVDYTLYTTGTSDIPEKSKSGKIVISPHIELQFADNTARFYCKVYFAEQFRQIRRILFPEGEDVFIRSLSRCKPWEAKGGKSGSTFCKTDDDRFILKQMSGMEVESFEKFGPQYFQYISKAEKGQRPVALAKIVGVYRIGFRNQMTNAAMKQDLLVMENLFYNRIISQKFDLKGSERNRMVKTNRKRDEELVLMDENFLRGSVDCPLYMLPHSKTMLTLAISHDSQFLCTNLVMDYSLLVGLDEQNKELVVGIIDYIRTFTWDKKLETIIKTNFGGQGKMPTVVSPEVYRSRFLDAMGKYFLQVPDQWSGLGNNVETS